MAVTATATDSIILGPGFKCQCYSVTMDSSYAGTAGEAVNMSTELPTEVYGAMVVSQSLGYVIQYAKATSGAPTTGVVRVYYPCECGTTGTVNLLKDVTTAADLHSLSFVLMAFGH